MQISLRCVLKWAATGGVLLLASSIGAIASGGFYTAVAGTEGSIMAATIGGGLSLALSIFFAWARNNWLEDLVKSAIYASLGGLACCLIGARFGVGILVAGIVATLANLAMQCVWPQELPIDPPNGL